MTRPGRRVARFRSAGKRQRGTILALTAVMITTMLGMISLSIDLGYAFSARNQLQNGVDSAALAGASALRTGLGASSVALLHARALRAPARGRGGCRGRPG